MQQIQITPQMKETASRIRGTDIIKSESIMYWIKNSMQYNNKYAEKRSRTASEILESKVVTGCIDVALVFIALTRASGIEASYIETIQKNWLKHKDKTIKGHIFSRVRINNQDYIVNPTELKIYETETYVNKNKEYLPIKEGLDSWDIGFKNNEDLRRFLEKEYRLEFGK